MEAMLSADGEGVVDEGLLEEDGVVEEEVPAPAGGGGGAGEVEKGEMEADFDVRLTTRFGRGGRRFVVDVFEHFWLRVCRR